MTDDHVGSKLAALLRTLKPKMKEPISAKVLNTWIAQAEGQLGDEARGGQLGWLIASSVAVGAVQRALDEAGIGRGRELIEPPPVASSCHLRTRLAK